MTSGMNLDYFKLDEDSTTQLHIPISTGVGESGTPLPHTLRGDNIVSISLLLCFVVYVLSLSWSGRFISHQLKDFFRSTHVASDDMPSFHFPIYLVMSFITCFMLAICAFYYATEHLEYEFVIENQTLVIAIFIGLFVVYFSLKWIAYQLVNGVFFGSNKSLQWSHAYLLLTALEGVLLFPFVLMIVYLGFNAHNALFWFAFILILNKVLTFYKCWRIFFKQKGRFLQIFLYFCALEATPLLAVTGVWLAIVNLLKVNF
jgi:hypothetical protein